MSHDAHDNNHPKYLAHHFDSMNQQFESGKLGMWVFLATEILMFGGLFVAYTIYRSNNPDVYAFAHQALNTKLGAINTAVLLISSFTMAWAVRAAQLSQKKLQVWLLLLTLLGGGGFMVIKTIEYTGKYAHGLFVGPQNAFFYDDSFKHAESGELAAAGEYISSHGDAHGGGHGEAHGDAHGAHDEHAGDDHSDEDHAEHAEEEAPAQTQVVAADHSTIKVAAFGPVGAATEAIETAAMYDGGGGHSYPTFEELSSLDQKRTHIFFQIYYCMTGLHGLHVVVGMAVIFWLLYLAGDTMARAWIVPLAPLMFGAYFVFFGLLVSVGWSLYGGLIVAALSAAWAVARILKARQLQQEEGRFEANYFTPVEVGGLYWHLVDLVWIFLFPLLYLIH